MRYLTFFALLLLPVLGMAADDPMGMGGGNTTENPSTPEKTTADYLRLIDGEDASDRLLSARVLKGQLKRALHKLEHGRPGSLSHDDARALMVELDERLPEACLNALVYSNVAAACSEILAMMEVRAAEGPIGEALSRETRKHAKKRIAAALSIIQALPPEAPPAAPAAAP